MAETAKAILVVGMHRSGTSALAGALSLLGIPLGDRLLKPGPDNPKGYWEHRDIVVVHERLLSALGSRWDDVRALPDEWQSSEPARRAAAAIAEIISRDFADQSLWAVKDPRICRLLPLWLDVLKELNIQPTILFMVRDPREVSASIVERNQWASPIGEILWLRYMSEALRHSRSATRGIVTYDSLLADPLDAVSAAAARLGLNIDKPSSEAGDFLRRFIDTTDRHHVGQTIGTCPDEKFGGIAKRVYDSLVDIARMGGDWVAATRAASDFAREWQRQHPVLEAFAGMTAKLNNDLQAYEVQIARRESELAAQIRWSEEAQQHQELLQAEKADLSSKLTAQIRWSEEAQQRQEVLQAEKADLSSKLTAQIRWSEEAQRRQELLQAENAELSSKLTAQVRWSEEAQQRQKALQTENVELASKLANQARLLEEVQQRAEVLRAEKAELSSNLAAQTRRSEELRLRQDALRAEYVALSSTFDDQTRRLSDLERELEQARLARNELMATLQRTSEEAEQVRTELSEKLRRSAAERVRLVEDLAMLRESTERLEAELRIVYGSRSWRATRPFRRSLGAFETMIAKENGNKEGAK